MSRLLIMFLAQRYSFILFSDSTGSPYVRHIPYFVCQRELSPINPLTSFSGMPRNTPISGGHPTAAYLRLSILNACLMESGSYPHSDRNLFTDSFLNSSSNWFWLKNRTIAFFLVLFNSYKSISYLLKMSTLLRSYASSSPPLSLEMFINVAGFLPAMVAAVHLTILCTRCLISSLF